MGPAYSTKDFHDKLRRHLGAGAHADGARQLPTLTGCAGSRFVHTSAQRQTGAQVLIEALTHHCKFDHAIVHDAANIQQRWSRCLT